MAIKKQFQPLVELLEANSDKKVKTIMNEILSLVESKTRGGSSSTSYRDDNGELVAIFDYYFKQWMPVSHIEFGAKASSNTGFNSMCKEGVSNWTRQQNAARKAEAQLLADAISGEVSPSDMGTVKDRIEAERLTVIPHTTGIGFDTIEDLLAADSAELDRMVEAVEEVQVEAA